MVIVAGDVLLHLAIMVENLLDEYILPMISHHRNLLLMWEFNAIYVESKVILLLIVSKRWITTFKATIHLLNWLLWWLLKITQLLLNHWMDCLLNGLQIGDGTHKLLLSHFFSAQDFVGDDQVTIGSRQSLPIMHSSCGILSSNSSLSLQLLDLLRVPNISLNLLSVNRLCADNNFVFIFDANFFLIQDKSSNNILFQGPSVEGLYPISSTPSTGNSNLDAHIGTRSSSSTWHNQLEHPSDSTLKFVLQSMHSHVSSSKCICYPCKEKCINFPLKILFPLLYFL